MSSCKRCSKPRDWKTDMQQRHVLHALLAVIPLLYSPAWAQEERCYPGPPLYIQRELLGGNYTPERYEAAILDYARSRCANKQLLKLVSPAGRDEVDRLNEDIALALCAPETIWREPLGAGEKAILLFCRISELAR